MDEHFSDSSLLLNIAFVPMLINCTLYPIKMFDSSIGFWTHWLYSCTVSWISYLWVEALFVIFFLEPYLFHYFFFSNKTPNLLACCSLHPCFGYYIFQLILSLQRHFHLSRICFSKTTRSIDHTIVLYIFLSPYWGVFDENNQHTPVNSLCVFHDFYLSLQAESPIFSFLW